MVRRAVGGTEEVELSGSLQEIRPRICLHKIHEDHCFEDFGYMHVPDIS